MKLPLLAMAMLVQFAGQPASPIPAIAQRLANATSLPDNELIVSFESNLPPARRQALEAAMVESTADTARLKAALATAYANHLTPAEMEGAVAFLESPLGASFERKMLKRQPDSLTPEEKSAVQAFVETPAGQAFAASERAVGQALLPSVNEFGEKVVKRAQEIHCRATRECGAFFPEN